MYWAFGLWLAHQVKHTNHELGYYSNVKLLYEFYILTFYTYFVVYWELKVCRLAALLWTTLTVAQFYRKNFRPKENNLAWIVWDTERIKS